MAKITCPVHASVNAIGGKWKPCILYTLQSGTFRFGALKREMPWISEKVLIRQLKELETDGIVQRTDHAEVPPRVDYALTGYGKTIIPVLQTMAQWGADHLAKKRNAINKIADTIKPSDRMGSVLPLDRSRHFCLDDACTPASGPKPPSADRLGCCSGSPHSRRSLRRQILIGRNSQSADKVTIGTLPIKGCFLTL